MTYTYGNPMPDADAHSASPARVLTRQRLLAVCAAMLVAVTTSSSGQTPALDTSPAGVAARAFNAGQFEKVDAALQAATDERSIVLRAKAAIARGRYADAEKLLAGVVASSPVRDAALELGQLYLYLGRRDEGARLLQAVLTRSPQNSPADLLRLGPCRARARPLPGRERVPPQRRGGRPGRSGHQHRVGRGVSRKVQQRRRREVVPGSPEGRRVVRAGAGRALPRRRRSEPAGRQVGGRSGAQGQPELRPGAPADRGARARRSAARRGARVDPQGARGEPEQPRSAIARRGDCAARRPHGRLRGGRRRRPQDQSAIRRRLPHGGRSPRAQLPVRRSRAADAPRARARSRRAPARTPTWDRICCAPATSPARAGRSRPRSRPTPTTSSSSTSSPCSIRSTSSRRSATAT